MIVYKDQAFCNAKCDKECHRKYTKEVADKAKEFGLPICLADLSAKCNYLTIPTMEEMKERSNE